MATECPKCKGIVKKNEDGISAQCTSCKKNYRIVKSLLPDIYDFAVEQKLEDAKSCDYCGETIKAAAIKCRHCGENLVQKDSPKRVKPVERTLFEGTPSQNTNIGWFIFCAFFIIVGMAFAFSNFAATISFTLCFGLLAFYRYVSIKYTQYRVTTERIEVEKGWISRQIDNLDLFRVKDVKVSIGIFDRLFGIGTVTVYSTDHTSSTLRLEGISNARELYDQLKSEVIRSDRRRGVVHIEA